MQKVYRAQAIVTSNPQREIFYDGFLAIDKNKILEVGPWAKRPRKLPVVDFSFGMITPGLFNLHTHLPMTLLRGIAEDQDFQSWLFKYIIPVETKWVSPEFVRAGSELALCEAIRNGVTFVSEMYYFEDEVASAIDRMGMRGLAAHHVWDMPAPDCPTKDAALESVAKLVKKFRNHPRVLPGIAPHAPYTVSQKTLRECANLAEELSINTMIHLAETKKEVADMMNQNKKTPTQYIAEAGILDVKNVLLAHSVWIADADMPLLARHNVSVVLNSQCNAKLASGVAPVTKFIKNKVRFTLGTDSAASNNNTDIFEEMNFLSKVHHLTEENLEGLPGPVVFEAATRQGAEAVGLGEKLGSLEPGKEADFIVIDLRTPHLTPLTNPYAHLIYSVTGADVDTVFVAGKCLMKNKKILIADEKKIISRANKFWSKIQKSL
jgi:5-methylthioadenosine/S-adenosylhomocysteine deaminase